MKTNMDFQEIITRDMSSEQIITLYRKMVVGELSELQYAKTQPEIVKEACDVFIVCDPLVSWGPAHDVILHTHIQSAMYEMIEGAAVNFDAALQKVVDSNFSKFILGSELIAAQKHFHELGIDVRFDQLDGEYYGAFSQKDQTVNGKFYECDKLLKGPNYQAVDESISWWK